MGVKTKSRPFRTSRLPTILEDGSSDTSESLKQKSQLEATKRSFTPRWSKMSSYQAEVNKQITALHRENAELEQQLKEKDRQMQMQQQLLTRQLEMEQQELQKAQREKKQLEEGAKLQIAILQDAVKALARRVKKKNVSEGGSSMSTSGGGAGPDFDAMEVDEILINLALAQ